MNMTARFGALHRFALALLVPLMVFASPPAVAAPKGKPDPVTHVYLIRGLANIFSMGLDTISADLKKAGVTTRVYGNLSGRAIREQILADRKRTGKLPNPIVLVGHSYGANAALAVSSLLARDGIPVDLVITIDPSVGGPLSPNVRRYVNYRFTSNQLAVPLESPSLGKRIKNVDLSSRKDVAGAGANHLTVTSNTALQKEIIATVVKQVGRRR